MQLDYESPEYHAKRHADLLKDDTLRVAWSYYSYRTYFHDITADATVLEFGAGLGNNVLTVKEKVKEVVCLEPSILGREVAQKDGLMAVKTLDEISDKNFTTILCRHVLEHVENPKEVLCSLREKLTPEGKLILVLPIEPNDQAPKENDINNHLFCWNPRTIYNLLKVCGYNNIECRVEAHGAKKKLMWIYKHLSPELYVKTIALVGKIFRFNELVIECKK
jgi:SAM-dependent methyltransferase